MFTDRIIKSFNELDYVLFNYISQNAEKVIYMRIRELAAETHVSTATILRFCKKLDCEGFSEFKVKLKLYLEKEAHIHLKSTRHTLTEFVERTLKGAFESYIQETADLISKCNQVIFLGIGSSGIMAQYGARHFSSLGTFSLHITDPFFPIYTQQLNASVTIALSVSGETPQIIDLIKKLKEEGSTIVSITNHKNCSIAKISDLNIAYYVTEEYINDSNITTQIPVVYILESIARELHKIRHS
ncbi:MurR/RpiR family transcriptional regulator [Paenactinomyces guangxiensis]|uniref:MurR/RpiR family transcriptional regulator n=1 Tax=Paenactinomyces guangxiensis TaxID=1490290 RepID=A0A7W2A6Y1_9BACL|nr:MurR/RpiR family transcriptional regulator [Paenactinomyces guangxiensis]MBA4492995.1 MurR/RpiR family transcriptional regulator [Paenactinomyces guangxiensis]MBH8590156.1 MurR/RpiR family transcriptional regulator [Paenactinomyces guangxiensis]